MESIFADIFQLFNKSSGSFNITTILFLYVLFLIVIGAGGIYIVATINKAEEKEDPNDSF